jgi:hypothetical protein
MNQPNLLLITVDQMRYDCLSAMGHPVVETPNLDALAAKGVAFTSAYSATPSCIPARAAIMQARMRRLSDFRIRRQAVFANPLQGLRSSHGGAGCSRICWRKRPIRPA